MSVQVMWLVVISWVFVLLLSTNHHDAGNSIIKAKIVRRECGEVAFPHAIKPLAETEYTNILTRAGVSGPPLDYVRVNGQPYVIGESAERHGVHIQKTGTARYTKEYYGIFAAAVLGWVYEKGGEVMVFGSHPPGDLLFREDLMRSAVGEWHIEVGKSERHFKVIYANTFDEPIGGLMNVLLTEDGQHLYSQHHCRKSELRPLCSICKGLD